MTKVRYGYTAASLVLILFYGYVAWLTFVPSTSQNYRLYFLDHKLKYWPHRNGLNYAFGEVMDFTDIVDYVSARGWDDPGQSGTWTNGRKATLYLRTPTFSDGRLVLCATVRGSVPPDPRLRAVQIRVNGKLVDTWAFGSAPWPQAGWITRRAIIPPGAMNAGGLQRLTFVIEGVGDGAARMGFSRLQLALVGTGGSGTRACRDPGGSRATGLINDNIEFGGAVRSDHREAETSRADAFARTSAVAPTQVVQGDRPPHRSGTMPDVPWAGGSAPPE